MHRRRYPVVLVALLALLAAACGGDDDTRPVPAQGILTVPRALDRSDLVDVDLASEPVDAAYALPGPWERELVVVGADRARSGRFVLTTQRVASPLPPPPMEGWRNLEVGGRPAQVGPSGDLPGCGRTTLTVQATADVRLVVSGVLDTAVDVLAEVAAAVRVEGDSIDTRALRDDHGRVARLPAEWLADPEGTHLGFQDRRLVVVRRAAPAEQRLLLGLRCPHPQTLLSPPPSTDLRDLAPYAITRRHVGGRTVDAGIVGQVQVAVVRGRPGAVVIAGLGCCSMPRAAALIELAGDVGEVPDAVVGELDHTLRERAEKQPREQLEADLANEGAAVVLPGRNGDRTWALARRSRRGDTPVPPELCFTPITTAESVPAYGYMSECLVDGTVTEPLLLAPPSPTPGLDHVWGLARPDVAVVEVTRVGRPPQRVLPVRIADGTGRRAFVAPLVPAVYTDGSAPGDLLHRSTTFIDGPIVLRALGTDGRELAVVAVGKHDCPVPPGCAP